MLSSHILYLNEYLGRKANKPQLSSTNAKHNIGINFPGNITPQSFNHNWLDTALLEDSSLFNLQVSELSSQQQQMLPSLAQTTKQT